MARRRRSVAARKAELEFSSWLLSVNTKFRVTQVRTVREVNRSFLIKNIPCDVSLRELYDQSRKFGYVKDLCVTERPSAKQSDRHKKHPRLAVLEFQKNGPRKSCGE
jgi:hypothetical protein